MLPHIRTCWHDFEIFFFIGACKLILKEPTFLWKSRQRSHHGSLAVVTAFWWRQKNCLVLFVCWTRKINYWFCQLVFPSACVTFLGEAQGQVPTPSPWLVRSLRNLQNDVRLVTANYDYFQSFFCAFLALQRQKKANFYRHIVIRSAFKCKVKCKCSSSKN